MLKALITGASSGIGWATAQYLVEKGYQVFGTTRSLKRRADLVSTAQTQYGNRLQFVEMDVTADEAVRQGVANILKRAGSLDVLICNAGWGIYGSIEEMPLSYVVQQFDTNVFGYLRTLQAVLPHLRAQRSGRIILVSSIGGTVAIPYQSHYSATKYAIEGLTQGLRQELRGFGIHVSAVRPGDINTHFNDVTYRYLPENSPYAHWSQKCWQTIDKNLQKAPPPSLVAKKIYRILQKKHPRAYYIAADPFTALTPILTPFLPSSLTEKIIRIFYGIDFL